jgi:hypothetical protein
MRKRTVELGHELQAFQVALSPHVSLPISSPTSAMRTTYRTSSILLRLFILIILDEGKIYEVLARLGVLTAELLNVQVFWDSALSLGLKMKEKRSF